MTIWSQHDIEQKITEILRTTTYPSPQHHFGHPYLTAYQIAIIFSKKYPVEFMAIGKPIGGQNASQQDSLSQYFALELSRRIKENKINDIEGGFLSCKQISHLEFDNGIFSSVQDISIFRYLK